MKILYLMYKRINKSYLKIIRNYLQERFFVKLLIATIKLYVVAIIIYCK